MRRPLLSAVIAAAVLASPATAFDVSAMSEEERAAFRAEIRSYLLDNPEVIMEAVQVLEARQAQAQAAQEEGVIAAHTDAIFNDGFSWVGGNPDGDITIVEFMDYRCGFCRRAHPEVEKLLANDGNVRLVIKEFPILGDASVVMSRFAVATHQVAGDDAYKAVHDVLMEMNGEPSDARLRRIAGDLDLDADAIMAQMGSDAVTEVISKNRALAQTLNISGTPSFVVADEILRGFMPADQMQMILEEKRDQG
jgi:protein-disulfide isomerase